MTTSSTSSNKDHIVLHITGMHCASCELLLERALREVPGIKKVTISHRTGAARITVDGARPPSNARLQSVIEKEGYALRDEKTSLDASSAVTHNKWLEIGGALLIVFILYRVFAAFDLTSIMPSTAGALSLGGVFLIGLVAGTSSCLAVTGGLLLALAAKHNELNRAESSWEKFRPLLHFNLGRLASYFILGGLVGVIGQSITLSTRMSGYMSIAVALIMLWLALSILKVIPKGSFPIRPPKRLSHWVAGLSESDHPAAPFALGAATFFLPCGFTQSLQLVALASGNFLTGALIMFTFALGTLPSLLGLSAVSSTARGAFSRHFLRFSGALVLVLALVNLRSGFTLAGIDVSRMLLRADSAPAAVASTEVNGVQVVRMQVTPYGYEPSRLTIKARMPVRWVIDGAGVQGCTSQIVIPALNVQKSLTRGQNIIEFTAPDKGPLAFSCSMGMVRGSFTVI